MIPFESAQELINSISLSVGTERVELMQSLNKVLAEDIISDMNIPPFNKSAMDGFACRKVDLANELEVIEEIPAGKVPSSAIGKNQCARIMTGAMVPEGANMVIQIEHVEQISDMRIKCNREGSGTNICYTGEDMRIGEQVLQKGITIRPQHIAILASAGITKPLVNKCPSIAVLSTGNELIEPEPKPEKSKIRNSNAYQLMAQASLLGYKPDYLGIVPDSMNEITNTLFTALSTYQVILISGGVSVGDYDLVPRVLNNLNVEIIFHGLEAKPGKHLLFGRKDNCLVFGLPGNPVSSFIQFEVLIKPLLNKLARQNSVPSKIELPLAEDYRRKKADTLYFIPGIYTAQNSVHPVEYHGSAHIHSYSQAQCIIEIPKGITQLTKGTLVNVRPI